MRILVVGVGVIGSVYAGKLSQAGHDVVLFARGRRLTELRDRGLVLDDQETGEHARLSLKVLERLEPNDRYDLVLVSVRTEQLASTLPMLREMTDRSDVLFFGNTTGQQAALTASLGERTVFGFPAAGGVEVGGVIRYVLISQQKTMLGEADGTMTSRLRSLRETFDGAGFDTALSADMTSWMLGHTAFVVPIEYALNRFDGDSVRLSADTSALELMVKATREAFAALGGLRNREIPANLRILYLCLPAPFVIRYWRGVLASPRGELWFGAHTRSAPEETAQLAELLLDGVRKTGRATPHLEALLASPLP